MLSFMITNRIRQRVSCSPFVLFPFCFVALLFCCPFISFFFSFDSLSLWILLNSVSFSPLHRGLPFYFYYFVFLLIKVLLLTYSFD